MVLVMPMNACAVLYQNYGFTLEEVFHRSPRLGFSAALSTVVNGLCSCLFLNSTQLTSCLTFAVQASLLADVLH